MSHPGVRASRHLISTRFVWRGLAYDVRDWCKSCLQWQLGKVLRHVHIHPEKIPVPFRRFAHVYVDLVDPLPSSHGFTYLFTCIDRSTRWPEAIPLAGISAAECAWMDLKVWRSFSDYKWQRSPVHFILVVLHLLPTQYQAQDHHSFPSSVQWHGGEVPQTVKEFSMCSSGFLQLVWTPTLGSIRIMYIFQRGLCHIRLWSCLCFWFNPAWSVPGGARTPNQSVLWKP